MKTLACAFLLLTSTVAFAADPADTSSAAAADGSTKAAKKSDPNRMVCEEQEETGSRLNSHRVCMPASEWAERRRIEREAIQRGQVKGITKNGI